MSPVHVQAQGYPQVKPCAYLGGLNLALRVKISAVGAGGLWVQV
jgi:hypothetical protein